MLKFLSIALFTASFFFAFLVPHPFRFAPEFTALSYFVSLLQNTAIFVLIIGLYHLLSLKLSKRKRLCFYVAYFLIGSALCWISFATTVLFRKNLIDVVFSILVHGSPLADVFDAISRMGLHSMSLWPALLIGIIACGAILFIHLKWANVAPRFHPRKAVGGWVGLTLFAIAALTFSHLPSVAELATKYDKLRGISITTDWHAKLFSQRQTLTLSLSQSAKEIPPARRPAQADPNARRVLLILLESWGADYLTEKETPFLWKLSEKAIRGRSTSSANYSTMAFYSLLSGYPSVVGEFASRTRDRRPNLHLVQRLKNLGLKFAIVGNSDMQKLIEPFGGAHAGGVDHFIDSRDIRKRSLPNSAVFPMAAELINRPEPWFVVLFPQTTHFPYVQAPECEVDSGVTPLTTIPAVKSRFLCSLRLVDRQINDMLASIRPEIADKTDIYIIGDHGEEFGEEGFLFHSSGLTSHQLETPFVVRSNAKFFKGREFPNFAHAYLMPLILCSMGDCQEREKVLLDECLRQNPPVLSSGPGMVARDCRLKLGNEKMACDYSRNEATDRVEIRLFTSKISAANGHLLERCLSYEPASLALVK